MNGTHVLMHDDCTDSANSGRVTGSGCGQYAAETWEALGVGALGITVILSGGDVVAIVAGGTRIALTSLAGGASVVTAAGTACAAYCSRAANLIGGVTEMGGGAAPGSMTPPLGGVYSLRDPETGEVLRTGRSVDLAQRQAQHANDAVLGDLEFHVEYRTDVRAEQRGLEQMLYDRYPGARFENGGFNKIRAVSQSNPSMPIYMQAALHYLEALGL